MKINNGGEIPLMNRFSQKFLNAFSVRKDYELVSQYRVIPSEM